MATQTVAPTDNQLNASQTIEGFSVVREDVAFGLRKKVEKDDKGIEKVTWIADTFKSPEDAEKQEKEGNAKNVGIVPVAYQEPQTFEALLSMADTPEKKEELVKNHNRGATTKLTNRMRAKLLAQDADTGEFTFSDSDLTNGALDLTDQIHSESKLRRLTEEQRIDKFLESQTSWTPDKKAKVRQIMLAAAV